METRENSPYIFISYARIDGKDYACKLTHSLQQCGYTVFLDETNIMPGHTFTNEIQDALEHATHMIVVLTPGSNQSEWVHAEVTTFRNQRKPVIPVYFQDLTLWHVLFSTQQYVDFRDTARYEQSFQDLVRDIESRHNRWRTRCFIDLGIHVDQNRLECIDQHALTDDAHFKMEQSNFAIRHLVVTETGKAGGRLLGLISLRQILKNNERKLAHQPYATHVHEIMTKYSPVRNEPPKPTFNYLKTGDTVEKVLEQFLEEMTKVPGTDHTFYMTAVPIVDDYNRAVGIVSFKDICQGILAKPQALPISPSKLLRDIMKQPLTADPAQTVSVIKMTLVTVGQRDAFVVNDRLEFLGMIPDIHMIKNEVANPNFPARHKKILVPPDHLKLQLPDKPVLDMLKEYNVESKLYYNFAVVDTLDLQTPLKLLGAVSYLEIIKALLEH